MTRNIKMNSFPPPINIYLKIGVYTHHTPAAFSLCSPFSPEQKLTIQVGDVNRVHVNDVYVTKAGEGQVFEKLATKTSCAYDKDFAVVV